MSVKLEFLAIHIPDLKQAEAYYQDLFKMDVITREAEQPDGFWYALPPDKGWADLDRAGIELNMLALRREEFVLAIFPGDLVKGQLFAIGLSMTPSEIDQFIQRIPKKDVDQYIAGEMIHFHDRYGFFWQIYSQPYRFRSGGESTNRWLKLD